MSFRVLFFFTFFLILLLGSGCEKKNDISEHSKPPLLTSPLTLSVAEFSNQAIPVWRKYQEAAPTLVLLSSDPFLEPIPAKVKSRVNELVLNGTPEEINAAGPLRASTLLFQTQTLSAALESGFFSEVVWIVPWPDPDQKIDVAGFKDRLFEIGALSDYEAQTVTPTSGGFSATVRETPFRATTIDHLPQVEGPIMLHVDLSYFRDLYKNEVKTPLYTLLFETCSALRQTEWPILAGTLSLNNLQNAVSLDARFFGPTIAEMFREPRLLESMPERWHIRHNILYLDAFFQPEEIHNLYKKLQKIDPADPSVDFGLYKLYKSAKQPGKALDHLTRAVQLDKGYAHEYLTLAWEALERNNLQHAANFYVQAAEAFPANPFIKLTLARHYLDMGEVNRASTLIEFLQSLDWSVYYPQIPQELKNLSVAAKDHPSS